MQQPVYHGRRPFWKAMPAARLWLIAAGALAALLCLLLAVGLLLHKKEKTPYEIPAKPPYVIAMDSGHGGADKGAVGCIPETQMTEKVVYYLNGWLKNDKNYKPIYTHTDGTGATIAQRTQVARKAGAQLFLSVHGNLEVGGDTARGFECYPTPPGRYYHDAALQFAHAITERMGAAGALLRGETGVRYAYYTSEKDKYSVEESDIEVRRNKSFGVVEEAGCPAVLVEQCFLTNAEDVQAWGFEDGCAKAARIYYEAICAYFGTAPIAA